LFFYSHIFLNYPADFADSLIYLTKLSKKLLHLYESIAFNFLVLATESKVFLIFSNSTISDFIKSLSLISEIHLIIKSSFKTSNVGIFLSIFDISKIL